MRKNYIGFKVSEHEHNLIYNKADEAKTSVSAFVRSCAIGKNIIVIDGMRELLPELSRVGNNLNQLTALLWSREIKDPNLESMKNMFADFFRKANSVFENGNH